VQNSVVSHWITQCVAKLKVAGVGGLAQYERRLHHNAKSVSVLKDLFFEGRAALMFQRNGFKVTLREKPDLQLELDEEMVYAEVKH